MIELHSDGGRYPYLLAPYKPSEIRAWLHVKGNEVRIRIDDLRNPDRWEELVAERRVILAELLKHCDESDRDTRLDSIPKETS